MAQDLKSLLEKLLADQGVAIAEIEERTFPGERWFVAFVPAASLSLAQSLAGKFEVELAAAGVDDADEALIVTFRPREEPATDAQQGRRGRLFEPGVDRLVQLLEARSRTSDALPSLKYVTDPRASLSAVRASRHHLVFGRRGVGKTALLLETKNWALQQGHSAAWINAHVLRDLTPQRAAASIALAIFESVLQTLGGSTAPQIQQLAEISDELRTQAEKKLTAADLANKTPRLNTLLRSILREDLNRLYVFVDDFYLIPLEHQAYLLDFLAGILRDSNGWLKIASIERLTRAYEPSTRIGLEVPHDASRIDLDVTLEEPAAAQNFLEAVLQNYLEAAGIPVSSRVAKKAALGRLVLASGGVPRDYLNLLAGSIVVAREARSDPRAIGKEDVAVAAGRAARSKKRDLEQDVMSSISAKLLSGLEALAASVRAEGYTYFRVSAAATTSQGYEILAQLADLRFLHLIQQGLSDQHKAGVKYEAYVLDLSEYTDIRLKRNLNILDLDEGKWTWRLTGSGRTQRALSGTKLRDRLRDSPIVDVDELSR